MNDSELFAFMDLFRSVTRVFPIRGDEDAVRDLGASYFKALRRVSLKEIQAGAEVCIQRGKHFPKPAEWLEAIPRRAEAVDVPVMEDAEAREYHRAETLKYEDAPCTCAACKEAHVEWKPVRFVPEFLADGSDRKVRDPIKDRIVTAGHWAHGWELAGYYRAKGAFYQKCLELGLKAPAIGTGAA